MVKLIRPPEFTYLLIYTAKETNPIAPKQKAIPNLLCMIVNLNSIIECLDLIANKE